MILTPFLNVTLLSLGLSFTISVIYRVLTNPDTVRKAKEDMKFYKVKMSEAQKAGDKAKANQHASEMLKASQLQFKLSMKPMMATMFLFLMILGWLNTSFGGVSADFGNDPDARFIYDGADHKLRYEKADPANGIAMKVGIDLNDDGQFSQDEIFDENAVFPYKGVFWQVGPVMEGFFVFASPKEDTVQFSMLVVKLPVALPFIGSYLTWFWWYIFVSIPSTIVFRKMLGVE